MSRPSIVLALLAASACSTHVAAPASSVQEPDALADGNVSYAEYQANSTAARESIADLMALEVLAVGEVIVDAPEGAHNCYGPCEDDATDQAWMQEHAWQVARLEALTAEAQAAAAEAPTADPASRQPDIDALNALQIVEIQGMFQETPANCYIGACPGDDERAGVISALAERTTAL